jgi:hypothetical protein
MVANSAGMVDLVALPVWIGTLVAHRQLDPQRAGGLVAPFLLSGVLASLTFAPRVHRLCGRRMATGGFIAAALAFVAVSQVSDYGTVGFKAYVPKHVQRLVRIQRLCEALKEATSRLREAPIVSPGKVSRGKH